MNDEPILVLITPLPAFGKTCDGAEIAWSEGGSIVWTELCILPATYHLEGRFYCADHVFAEAVDALKEGLGWLNRSVGDRAEGEAAREGDAVAGLGSDTPASHGHLSQDNKEGER